MMCDHGPTHIDSVSHLSTDPDAPSVDRDPPGALHHRGDLPGRERLDAARPSSARRRSRPSSNAGIWTSGRATRSFSTPAHYDRFYGTPEYATHQPGLTRDATEYIIDQGAVNFGVDNTSPDMWLDKTYPCHMVCRERRVTHIENLCNLDKLVGKRFTFIALPLKIRKGTGSPIRAVAIIDG